MNRDKFIAFEPPIFKYEITSETLRDKFAMAALTGTIASAGGIEDDKFEFSNAARTAYDYADAMLKARGAQCKKN